jgi:HAD superfamily phosphatase (TIGR01681 family)
MLNWLPPSPANFRERCAALTLAKGGCGQEIRKLATYRLDEKQLSRLGAVIKRLPVEDLFPLLPLRLAVLSNATTDHLLPALAASAARHGLGIECWSGPFGVVAQQVLDPSSALNRWRPNFVLLVLDHRSLNLEGPLGQQTKTAQCIEAASSLLRQLCRGIRTVTGATAIVQTIPGTTEPIFGSLDFCLAGTLRNNLLVLNQQLVSIANDEGALIFDTARLAETVGLVNWTDPKHWHLAKLPFAPRFVPIYAEYVSRILMAARGKARKCLVLDLDNTLWGGVIGDDGLGGIHVGNADATGEAYLDLQRAALRLRERGIVLAVCSKNDDEIARQPFRHHPEMILREEHFAVFQANWDPKPDNLRRIAERLQIGIDSLVMVDDSAFERELLRRELPEDRLRADQYGANARRLELQTSATNLTEYLASLEVELVVASFSAVNRARITQLINKTNQFNLTTQRYSEAEIENLERDPKTFTLQVRLKDKFGDNGIISVVVCTKGDDFWTIDSWLMSCRVLQRQVEEALLNELASAAVAEGATALEGTYVPSGRNSMVALHYERLGFEPLAKEGEITRWRLLLANFKPFVLQMTIRRADC